MWQNKFLVFACAQCNHFGWERSASSLSPLALARTEKIYKNSRRCIKGCHTKKKTTTPSSLLKLSSEMKLDGTTLQLYSLRSKLVVFHLSKSGYIQTCYKYRYIHFLVNRRQLIWNGGSTSLVAFRSVNTKHSVHEHQCDSFSAVTIWQYYDSFHLHK